MGRLRREGRDGGAEVELVARSCLSVSAPRRESLLKPMPRSGPCHWNEPRNVSKRMRQSRPQRRGDAEALGSCLRVSASQRGILLQPVDPKNGSCRPGALTHRKRGRAVSALAGSRPAAGCRCHSAPRHAEERHPCRRVRARGLHGSRVWLIPTRTAVFRLSVSASLRGILLQPVDAAVDEPKNGSWGGDQPPPVEPKARPVP